MTNYKAVEYAKPDLTATGRVEYYSADSAEDAAEKCLYTRQLEDANASLGPTKRVVHSGDKCYPLVPDKETPCINRK